MTTAARTETLLAPHLVLQPSGVVHELAGPLTTIGRGEGVDVRLDDPTVSRLHAELVQHGPHLYVSDLGLSANGTRVNGRVVGRRLLQEGDVLSFGTVRARVRGLPQTSSDDTVALHRLSAPELTRREREVLAALCRPALEHATFVAPASAQQIAGELVVTEAAVKQHLLRLYAKFRIPEGPDRRARLANEVVSQGVVRPGPTATELDLREHAG